MRPREVFARSSAQEYGAMGRQMEFRVPSAAEFWWRIPWVTFGLATTQQLSAGNQVHPARIPQGDWNQMSGCSAWEASLPTLMAPYGLEWLRLAGTRD